ncbi:MAG: hypothetical protein K1X55_17195 [Chitinophagales bacterium]|nr:hypothetical protein [Chitinophagales bacterium]
MCNLTTMDKRFKNWRLHQLPCFELKNKAVLLILSIYFCTFMQANGQQIDAKEIYLKMNNRVQSLGKIEYSMVTEVYDSTQQLLQKDSFYLEMIDQYFYSTVKSQQLIYVPDAYLIVDNYNKSITRYNPEHMVFDYQGEFMTKLEKLIPIITHTEKVKENNLYRYNFTLAHTIYKSVGFLVDDQFTIKDITLTYQPGQGLSHAHISYPIWNETPNIKLFDHLNSICTIDTDTQTITGVGIYKDYLIIDKRTN